MSEFIITKTLKNNYKNPLSIAHKVLADRVAKRDPGNAIQCNERVPYAYIELINPPKGTLQGERIETPDYIKENNLKLDYSFYLSNQIKKPIISLFEILMDNPSELFETEVVGQFKAEKKERERIDKNKKERNMEITDFFNIKLT